MNAEQISRLCREADRLCSWLGRDYVQERIDAAKSHKRIKSMWQFQTELTRVGLELDKEAGIE